MHMAAAQLAGAANRQGYPPGGWGGIALPPSPCTRPWLACAGAQRVPCTAPALRPNPTTIRHPAPLLLLPPSATPPGCQLFDPMESLHYSSSEAFDIMHDMTELISTGNCNATCKVGGAGIVVQGPLSFLLCWRRPCGIGCGGAGVGEGGGCVWCMMAVCAHASVGAGTTFLASLMNGREAPCTLRTLHARLARCTRYAGSACMQACTPMHRPEPGHPPMRLQAQLGNMMTLHAGARAFGHDSYGVHCATAFLRGLYTLVSQAQQQFLAS